MNEPPAEASATATFVLRFWREWSDGTPRWRGRIENVQSGQAANFLGTAGLVAFLWQFGICCEPEPQQMPDEYELD